MIKRLITDRVFNPNAAAVQLLPDEFIWTGSTPFLRITRPPPKPEEPFFLVKFLFNYGNLHNHYSALKFVAILADRLSENLKDLNCAVLAYVWDYPGYGASKVPLGTIETLHKEAEQVYEELLQDTGGFCKLDENSSPEACEASDGINVVIGYSLGSSPACYLSKNESTDIVFLIAPFGDALTEQGYSFLKYLMGDHDFFNNKTLLKYKNPYCIVIGAIGEYDIQTPPTKSVCSMFDIYELLQINHDAFMTNDVLKYLGDYLSEQIKEWKLQTDHIINNADNTKEDIIVDAQI